MAIKFGCKKCGQNIEIEDTSAGKIVPCPKCKAILLVPTRLQVPPPAAAPPPPAQQKSRPSFLIASTIALIALLAGSCFGYFLKSHATAKADAQVAATRAMLDGKTGEVARVEAQLVAVKATLDEKTSEVARVEAQLVAAKAALSDKSSEVARAEAQLASVRASLSAYTANTQTAKKPASQSKGKAKKKKK
ncbi:MAG: hypothetical protein NTY53_00805 [Kiritimatiellaeota bacterium]|nr:hypothetical protein [Kiritimatiellota bacterium]